jgi:hypothetical protein
MDNQNNQQNQNNTEQQEDFVPPVVSNTEPDSSVVNSNQQSVEHQVPSVEVGPEDNQDQVVIEASQNDSNKQPTGHQESISATSNQQPAEQQNVQYEPVVEQQTSNDGRPAGFKPKSQQPQEPSSKEELSKDKKRFFGKHKEEKVEEDLSVLPKLSRWKTSYIAIFIIGAICLALMVFLNNIGK